MTTRNELADLIASVTIDTTSGDVLRVHPDGETPVFEGDQRTANAILAAGYSKPRTITTVDELDALPVGSVLNTEFGAWEKVSDPDDDDDITFWLQAGNRRWNPSRDVGLPATVLHEGDAS